MDRVKGTGPFFRGHKGACPLFVAGIWLVQGLYSKLLGGVPRQLAIVQAVPGLDGSAGELVLGAVGLGEVWLACWILSQRAPYLCAATQTIALLGVNSLELAFARDHLLWPAGLLPLNLGFLVLAWIAADQSGGWRIRSRLRRHPIPMTARLQHCLTLTYAVPAAVLRPMVPPGLELETLGESGFVAVALVRTRALRPAGLPPALGGDFFLAGYRVFTRFRRPNGRSLRGLRILRSDADRTGMVVGGNLLTHYNYHRSQATFAIRDDRLDVTVGSRDGAGDLRITARLRDSRLPAGSPFATLREARRFAGPLPFTFDYEPETRAVIAIEARRTHWQPAPVAVDVHEMTFFDGPAFAGCTPRLAAAFYVSDVDYRWNRGRRYPLAPTPGEAFA